MGLINNVFILVNANSIIGSGHLVRCRIIAEELLKYNIKSVFIFSDTDPKYSDNISKLFDVIIIDKQPSNILENILNEISRFDENKLLIIDSDNCDYYNEHFQKRIINSGIKLMHITVNPDYHYFSHILLNQNIIALDQEYLTENYTKKLLGPEFFIFNSKLRNFNLNHNKLYVQPYNLFIAFGGADHNNLTERILDPVYKLRKYFNKINVVVGRLNKNYERINNRIKEINDNDIYFHYDTDNIYPLMQEADIAICSSGLTFWELIVFDVPSFMIASSEREKNITDFLDLKKYCFKLGHFDNIGDNEELAKTIEYNLNKDFKNNLNLKEIKELININGIYEVGQEIINIIHE